MRQFDDCFEELYRRAYGVAFKVLGDCHDAEDIAQETLARAHDRWRKVEAYAGPWVVRVGGNLAVDRARRRARRPPLPSPPPDPLHDERLDLQRALLRLPRRQREVVVLRYLADLSEDTVASLLGCSTGTVKQHASRGLAALRRLSEVTSL